MDFNIDLKDDPEPYQQHNQQRQQQPSQPQTHNYNQNAFQSNPKLQQNIKSNKQAGSSSPLPSGCFKFFSIEFYEQFFQVKQEQVIERMTISLIPIRRQFIEKIRDSVDFYGPFWILTTIIFLLGSAGNMANYLNNWSNDKHTFDLKLVRIGVVFVYSIGFGFPTVLFFVTKFLGCSRLSLPQLICMYGYSFTCFIIVFLLCIIPFGVIHWILMIYGMVNTVVFLILNLMEYLSELQKPKQYIVFGIIGAMQIALFLTFKLVFFSLIYEEEMEGSA